MFVGPYVTRVHAGSLYNALYTCADTCTLFQIRCPNIPHRRVDTPTRAALFAYHFGAHLAISFVHPVSLLCFANFSFFVFSFFFHYTIEIVALWFCFQIRRCIIAENSFWEFRFERIYGSAFIFTRMKNEVD